MQKGKNEIVVEYIENILNTSSLYTNRIYRWMNKEGRSLFDMDSVEKEFFKQGKISLKEEKEDAEFEFDDDFGEKCSDFHRKLLIPVSRYKDMILSACEKEKQQKKKDYRFEKRLNWLGIILGLTTCEFSILRLYAYIRRSQILSAFLSDIFPCRGYRYDFYISDHPEILSETEERIAKAIASYNRIFSQINFL